MLSPLYSVHSAMVIYRWEKVDLKNNRITLLRTKNDERGVLPLVGKANDLIKHLYLKVGPENKDLLFPFS